MTTQNEVIRALRDFAHEAVFAGWRKMLTGRRTETNTITMAGAPAGKTWVRAHDASREQTAVWGFVGIPNVTVWVAPGVDGENRITAIDYSESVQAHGDKVLLAQQPPLDGNLNAVLISGQNFQPGRLRAYAESGSMLVYVEPFAHRDGYYAGGTIDLTGDVPSTSGTNAWVAVALDPATDTLYSYQGSESYDSASNLDVADAHAISVPDTYLKIGAVALNSDTTEITPGTRIIDLRSYLSAVGYPALDSLSNVDTTGKADGDTLVWDAGTSEWVPGGGAAELDDLTDVDLTTPPTDGQGLKYNAAASKWEPGDFAGGGGSTITGDVLPSTCQGRLTLTTGVPLPTSDVTAADTLYFTPYHGNVVALHDGTSTWTGYTFTESALALGALSADTNYDVFLWDDSGTLKLEAVAWTDGTTRATGITTQDGIYVKSGATTHRYLGTIRTTATAGQCEDSAEKRFVWNYYNQVQRPLKRSLGNSYAYGTNTWRQAAGNSANKISIVVGDPTLVKILCERGCYTNGAGRVLGVSIGLGSTTPAADGGFCEHYTTAAELTSSLKPSLHRIQAAGYQEYWPLEKASATGYFSALNADVIAGEVLG